MTHVQADCKEPGSAPEPYARQSSVGYLLDRQRRHTCSANGSRVTTLPVLLLLLALRLLLLAAVWQQKMSGFLHRKVIHLQRHNKQQHDSRETRI